MFRSKKFGFCFFFLLKIFLLSFLSSSFVGWGRHKRHSSKCLTKFLELVSPERLNDTVTQQNFPCLFSHYVLHSVSMSLTQRLVSWFHLSHKDAPWLWVLLSAMWSEGFGSHLLLVFSNTFSRHRALCLLLLHWRCNPSSQN